MSNLTHSSIRIRQQQSLHFLTALPSKTPKPAINKMEAQLLINKIAASSANVFKNVVLLMTSQGYLALGFNKPQECLRKKIPELSNSYICRLLKATAIYVTLDAKLEHLNKVTEATFRPLQSVSDEDAQAVWQQLLATCNNNSNKRFNSRNVTKAMEVLGITASVSTSKAKPSVIKLNEQLQHRVERCAKKIGQVLISPNVSSKEEWQQLASLIYQQLMATCPLVEPLKKAA